MEMPAKVEMGMPISNMNIVTFSGYFNVTEDIKGELEFNTDSFRCSFDMKTCEKYPGKTYRDLCKIFRDKNSFFRSFFEKINPNLKCPLKSGIYNMEETKIDFSLFAMLPLDGFVWVSTLKLLSAEPGIKRKRIVMCINAETKIVRTAVKKPS